MHNLITFLDDKARQKKAQFVGFVAALCALFISIDVPSNIEAQKALAVIQLFWLVLLTLSLSSLFIDFIIFVWKKEKAASKHYDLPLTFVFSAFVGVTLAVVILNLWRYILALYSSALSSFIILIGFPGAIAIACVLLLIFIKQREERIAPILQMLADSFILGALIGVAGFYLQEALTGVFYFYWFLKITPIVIVLAFLIVIVFRKEKSLWS